MKYIVHQISGRQIRNAQGNKYQSPRLIKNGCLTYENIYADFNLDFIIDRIMSIKNRFLIIDEEYTSK